MSCPEPIAITPLIIGLAPVLAFLGILLWIVIRATRRLMP